MIDSAYLDYEGKCMIIDYKVKSQFLTPRLGIKSMSSETTMLAG